MNRLIRVDTFAHEWPRVYTYVLMFAEPQSVNNLLFRLGCEVVEPLPVISVSARAALTDRCN